MNHYFIVTAKCGHAGLNRYIPINFAVIASSRKEASQIVLNYPRVKRNHKDAIFNCEEVEESSYLLACLENDKDPYLHCTNIQEQRAVPSIYERMVLDVKRINRENKKHANKINSRHYRALKMADIVREKDLELEYIE